MVDRENMSIANKEEHCWLDIGSAHIVNKEKMSIANKEKTLLLDIGSDYESHQTGTYNPIEMIYKGFQLPIFPGNSYIYASNFLMKNRNSL